MGDHYVTKGYLRAWHRNGGLWGFDREKNVTFPGQAGSVANITNFYSPGVETALANELDGPAVVVLREFSAGRTALSPAERELVARFLYVQWKRTPRAKDRVLRSLPHVEREQERKILAEIEMEISLDPEFAIRGEQLRGEMTEFFKKQGEADRTAIWNKSILQTTGPHVHDSITSMNWVLVKTPDESLLTCDNPMYFHEHLGLARTSSEITFPLSPSTALWATRQPIANGAVLNCNANMAREINRRTAKNSSRWVFFSEPRPWIEPFLKKGNWQINRIQ